jgi:ABC-type multidrug transport system ATPase subunit
VLVRGEDLFHDMFTAKELLTFAASLRVKPPKSHRDNVVEAIIRDFELQNYQNVRICNYKKKKIPEITKRKISIALEILDNPDIIFIDDLIGGSASGGISNDRVGQFALLSTLRKEAKYNFPRFLAHF